MAVKQKLRSRRGATLMAALLFFLVAAVCGSIILAAATATLSRMTTQAEDARAYYSLTSAAQLVRGELLNSHWKVEVTQTKPDESIVKSYKIFSLDKNGNDDDSSFIRDLLNPTGGSDDDSVYKTERIITISTSGEGDTLPTIYARPENMTYGVLYGNYQKGDNTELKLLMTNDPDGFKNGTPTFRSSYKDTNGKNRQVYWLELTLDSVKVPSGYVDNTDEQQEGKVEFQVGWDNVSIRKLEN